LILKEPIATLKEPATT